MYQESASPEAGVESAANPSDAPAQAQVEAPLELAEQAERDAEQLAAADTRESAHLFREELARAMQAAADRERQRIEMSVDEEATAHVEKVRSRASAEAGELKRLAEQDVAGIRAWAKSEIERIRSEADIQIGSRRERLEQHLVAHATIIDGEIDRVSEAVEGYRHELDVFFARLGSERDPSEIARLADTVPEAPDFEVIRAVARADAVNRLSALEAAADEAAAEEPGETAEAVAESGEAVTEPTVGAAESGEAATEPTAGAAEPVATQSGESAPESSAPVTASAESAGETADAEPELVAVMDPALAARADEPVAEATVEGAEAGEAVAAPSETQTPSEAQAPSEAGTSGSAEVATADAATADAATADAATADAAPVADMTATAGEAPAESTEAMPEPVGAAAPSGPDTNPAARFIRSLTSWGSNDHGSHDASK